MIWGSVSRATSSTYPKLVSRPALEESESPVSLKDKILLEWLLQGFSPSSGVYARLKGGEVNETELLLEKCSGWEDSRSPDEIIAEIYAARSVSLRGLLLDEAQDEND